MHGFACDAVNSFPVALTKKGLKRVMGKKSHQKQSITVDYYGAREHAVLDLSIPTQAAPLCLFLVAFSLFRENPISPLPMLVVLTHPNLHLTRNDIKFPRNGAVFRIR